jgi:hypothetical protein
MKKSIAILSSIALALAISVQCNALERYEQAQEMQLSSAEWMLGNSHVVVITSDILNAETNFGYELKAIHEEYFYSSDNASYTLADPSTSKYAWAPFTADIIGEPHRLSLIHI